MASIPHLGTISNINGLWSWGGWGSIPRWPYVLQMGSTWWITPVDSTTYYLGNWSITTWVDNTDIRMYIPQRGVITKAYIEGRTWGTWGSTEQSTMSLVVTTPAWTTTETVISSVVTTNAVNNSFNNTALSVQVNEWDYICVKWVTPNYGTNPTGVIFSFTFAIEPRPLVLSWSKYVIQWWQTSYSPASGVTTYFGNWILATWENMRIRVSYTWIITNAAVSIRSWTVGTIGVWNVEFLVRKDATSEESIGTSLLPTTNVLVFSNSLSMAVTAWDYLTLKVTNWTRAIPPTWVTVTFSFWITIT